jgi:predicted SAM-dependent methyltransferase
MFKSIKRLLKRSQFIVALARALPRIVVDAQVLAWTVSRRLAISDYVQDDRPRKLHLGAGNWILPGWLNTDLFPTHRGMIYLDVTRRFPFADSTFDYVFSEHMIEHVDYDSGMTMLRECYRILKPGGKIRIATPDLEVLIGLHSQGKTDLQRRYIQWFTDRGLPGGETYNDVFVINNAFRAWGHTFLYDRETLRTAMAKVGFENLTFGNPGVSDDANLSGLESHGKEILAEEINQFETFVVEGEAQKREKGLGPSSRRLVACQTVADEREIGKVPSSFALRFRGRE